MQGADQSKATIEEVEARAAYWETLARQEASPKLAKIAGRRAQACRTAAELMRKKQERR